MLHFFFFYYWFYFYLKGRVIKINTKRSSIYCFIPQMEAVAKVGRLEAMSQEFLAEMQGLKDLSRTLLLSQTTTKKWIRTRASRT